MAIPLVYDKNVFINCPDDKEYLPLFRVILFTVIDCGFKPRNASEERYSAKNRLSKIERIIAQCKFGIHDISKTELNENGLPRFNMPLELGIFLGALRFGDENQRKKKCLIMDKEEHRYQQFISDLAGQDIASHNNKPKQVVARVRDWLADASKKTLPSGSYIWEDYRDFQTKLPTFCRDLRFNINQLTFHDYTMLVEEWLNAAEI